MHIIHEWPRSVKMALFLRAGGLIGAEFIRREEHYEYFNSWKRF